MTAMKRYRWDSPEYAEAFATLLRCYGSREHLYAVGCFCDILECDRLFCYRHYLIPGFLIHNIFQRLAFYEPLEILDKQLRAQIEPVRIRRSVRAMRRDQHVVHVP